MAPIEWVVMWTNLHATGGDCSAPATQRLFALNV